MERKQFIRIIAAGGLAVHILPGSFLLKAAPFGKIIDLPATDHVRHGLLDNNSQVHALPAYVKAVRLHRFFGNGYAVGENDLLQLSMEVREEKINVQLIGEQLWFTAGDQEARHFSVGNESQLFLKEQTDWSITFLNPIAEPMEIHGAQEYLFFCLEGDCEIDGDQLSQAQAFHIKGKEQLLLTSASAARLLVLQKSHSYKQ